MNTIDPSLVKWCKRLVILIFSLILYFFCQHIGVVKAVINVVYALTPLYIAIFISWLLKPIAKFFNQKCKMNYFMACALSICIFIVIVCGIVFSIIPEIIIQIRGFIDNISGVATSLFTQLQDLGIFDPESTFFKELDVYLQSYNTSVEGLIKQGLDFAKNNIGGISSGVTSVVGIASSAMNMLMNLSFGIILSFYLMPNLDHYVNLVVKKLKPEHQKTVSKDLKSISTTLRAYLKGLLLDTFVLCLILSISVSIFFGTKMGILSAVVFSLIAALLNIIPYIGSIIGAVPLALVVFPYYGFWGILGVIVIVTITQFLEANVISPRIMSNTINMHPVTLMSGLLVFSTIFGFAGMFISTPLLSIIKIFLVKFDIVGEDDL